MLQEVYVKNYCIGLTFNGNIALLILTYILVLHLC